MTDTMKQSIRPFAVGVREGFIASFKLAYRHPHAAALLLISAPLIATVEIAAWTRRKARRLSIDVEDGDAR